MKVVGLHVFVDRLAKYTQPLSKKIPLRNLAEQFFVLLNG